MAVEDHDGNCDKLFCVQLAADFLMVDIDQMYESTDEYSVK